MVNSKVQTAIVNHTQQVLVLRVGNRNCFAKLATIAVGGEHKIEIDVNWTYQEFSLEPAGHLVKKIIVSSDDCCDYERITVTMSDGSLQTDEISLGHGRCYVDDHPVNNLTAPLEQLNCNSDHSLRPWLPKELKFNWRFWTF